MHSLSGPTESPVVKRHQQKNHQIEIKFGVSHHGHKSMPDTKTSQNLT